MASTSEVYGKNDQIPFNEEHDLVMGPTSKARWAYACTKAIDEFLALSYHRARGLPVVVVRLFNTVGPRQTGRYGMVLPSFVRQALMGRPITVYRRRHPVALLLLRARCGALPDRPGRKPRGGGPRW